MNRHRWLRGALLLLLAAADCSCAHQSAEGNSRADALPRAALVPMQLRGNDTRMRLALTPGNQTVAPGEFQKDEICYLTIGGVRIECFDNGATLNFGPEDSTPLLSDNPMWDISSDEDNPTTAEALRLYGVIFLVGSSVERLPDTLADYIQDPGRHEAEAVALAASLVNTKQVELEGHARGGNFTVRLQLTDAGREKLVNALDDAQPGGKGSQMVNAPVRRAPPAVVTRVASPCGARDAKVVFSPRASILVPCCPARTWKPVSR